MIEIKPFCNVKEQISTLGRNNWSVARLIELARELPVMEIPLEHLNIYYLYDKMPLRDMIAHFQAVNNADLSFPIILDEDGEIMDGRHRVMKAIMTGQKTIKAVRFTKNPYPCKIDD